jgi:hypothetical protein
VATYQRLCAQLARDGNFGASEQAPPNPFCARTRARARARAESDRGGAGRQRVVLTRGGREELFLVFDLALKTRKNSKSSSQVAGALVRPPRPRALL